MPVSISVKRFLVESVSNIYIHPRLADSSRQMVLLEPVTRSVARLEVSQDGNITAADQGAEVLFQVRS